MLFCSSDDYFDIVQINEQKTYVIAYIKWDGKYLVMLLFLESNAQIQMNASEVVLWTHTDCIPKRVRVEKIKPKLSSLNTFPKLRKSSSKFHSVTNDNWLLKYLPIYKKVKWKQMKIKKAKHILMKLFQNYSKFINVYIIKTK